ncbi:MAG TPA: MFS transporter [Solirubrobacteraceae bacterium]|nr:MFS transporter [Solirubrobacteraceae bacterium]
MEQKWWTLIAVCVGIFMLLIDITVVNVALPSIQRSLHASFSDLQWVVNTYALMLAALLLTAGSLADLFGRKLLFTVGLVIFTAASLTCGLAQSPLMLNASRAVQGIGGAIMLATSLALIAEAFRGRDRATAFAAYGAVVGAAVAVGPLVGGALTSGLGWRWIFFVNLPIGVGGVILTIRAVSESRDPAATRVDWLGLTTFSGSLFLWVYALIEGNSKGWGSGEIIGCLAGAFALLCAFALAELRQERPMFDLTLLRRPAFAGASIVAFAISASMFSLFLYLTLYLQNVLGYSAFQTGLRFLPMTMILFVIAPLAGRATLLVPIRVILAAGLVLVAVGLVLMSGLSGSSGWTHLLPGFIIGGIGIGFVNPPLAATAVGVVPHHRSGMASGINNTCRQVGFATGIAALGAIFQHEVSSRTLSALRHSGQLNAVLSGTHGRLQSTFASGSTASLAKALPAGPRAALISSFHTAFTGALNEIFLIAAAIALAGAIGGLVLVRRSDFIAQPGASASPAAA